MAPQKTAPIIPSRNPSFVLWHRQNARRKWRSVAQALTSAALNEKMVRSGDYLTLPAGENPNLSGRWVRR